MRFLDSAAAENESAQSPPPYTIQRQQGSLCSAQARGFRERRNARPSGGNPKGNPKGVRCVARCSDYKEWDGSAQRQQGSLPRPSEVPLRSLVVVLSPPSPLLHVSEPPLVGEQPWVR